MFKKLNEIILGDCVTVMGEMPTESIDLVVTSPPYCLGIDYASYDDSIPYDEYLEWCNEWIGECVRLLKHSGRIAINIPIESNVNGKKFIVNDYMNILNSYGLLQTAFIAWDKRHVTSRTAWGSWKSPSCPAVNNPLECILVYSKGDKKKDGDKSLIDITDKEFIAWTLGVWEMQPESDRSHPAPFPVELPRRVIKLYSYQKDVVLDPFSGSGTTAVACHQNNRNFICIEKDKGYWEKSLQRLKSERTKRALV